MLEGRLKKNSIGRWEIVSAQGEHLFELTCGDVFQIETENGMKTTRMEAAGSRYCTIDGYPLRLGLKARYDASKKRYVP